MRQQQHFHILIHEPLRPYGKLEFYRDLQPQIHSINFENNEQGIGMTDELGRDGWEIPQINLLSGLQEIYTKFVQFGCIVPLVNLRSDHSPGGCVRQKLEFSMFSLVRTSVTNIGSRVIREGETILNSAPHTSPSFKEVRHRCSISSWLH